MSAKINGRHSGKHRFLCASASGLDLKNTAGVVLFAARRARQFCEHIVRREVRGWHERAASTSRGESLLLARQGHVGDADQEESKRDQRQENHRHPVEGRRPWRKKAVKSS
jgi:hypothetical protein